MLVTTNEAPFDDGKSRSSGLKTIIIIYSNKQTYRENTSVNSRIPVRCNNLLRSGIAYRLCGCVVIASADVPCCWHTSSCSSTNSILTNTNHIFPRPSPSAITDRFAIRSPTSILHSNRPDSRVELRCR
jgi:hypothetical protein